MFFDSSSKLKIPLGDDRSDLFCTLFHEKSTKNAGDHGSLLQRSDSALYSRYDRDRYPRSLQQISDLDRQISKDTYGNGIIKTIQIRCLIIFKIKNIHDTFCRVDDPVFTYSGRTIFKKLDPLVYPLCAGGSDLDHPVRCAFTAPMIYFIFITYD